MSYWVVGAALVMSVMRAATSMYGMYVQGEAAKDAADYQAKLAEEKARQAREMASREKEDLGQQHARDVALGRVNVAASGLLIDSGSVQDWEGDMIDSYEVDKIMTDHNSELVANGLLSEAAMSRAEGKNAQLASWINMGATAFSSAWSLGMSTAALIK